MFAEIMGENAYRTYRIKLDAYLNIPLEASEQEIHKIIEAGFFVACVTALSRRGGLTLRQRNRISSLKSLELRLGFAQRLTTKESDNLFRVAHIIALAETIFGNEQKAQRWLSKSKEFFMGNSPLEMLSTTPGTHLVEQKLIQLAQGMAF
jgi:putative toxin-antitoxin system antitoxin component (TIGR02293 family)